jgi:uncharacterized integral membrane protein
LFRLLLSLPFVLLLVLFALSNTQAVRLGLWPTDLSLVVPVAVVILVAMAAAFLLGAALVWVSVLGARLRARRAEHTVRLLEAQVAELKAELTPLRARASPRDARPALAALPWRG